MKEVLRSNQRGHANFGWLDSFHTFSFGDYYNPKKMGFRALRVINEDGIAAGAGFPMHGHRDMEIITVVTKGVLEHKDTLGTSAQIRPGEVQRMSAGTGIRHSEYNPSDKEETHLFQIWILPDKEGYSPSYGQKSFAAELEKNNLVLAVSQDGRAGSIKMNQDTNVYLGRLGAGEKINFSLGADRHLWLQMIEGEMIVSGEKLIGSDAIALNETTAVEIRADKESRFILFDLN